MVNSECHVKERARRYFQKRFGDGEAETYEFGVVQPLEYEEEVSARFGRFQQTGDAKAEQSGVFNQRLETDVRHEPRSSRAFSSEATGRHS